jgi:type IV secretion system protein VirD4
MSRLRGQPTMASTSTPRRSRWGNALVFVVIPPEYFMTHRSWLRLCITAFAGAFKRNKPDDVRATATRRHICIDEFANLGKLSAVETAAAVERGYGIQYHLYVQHLGQLENEYGRNWETFVANCAVQGFKANQSS